MGCELLQPGQEINVATSLQTPSTTASSFHAQIPLHHHDGRYPDPMSHPKPASLCPLPAHSQGLSQHVRAQQADSCPQAQLSLVCKGPPSTAVKGEGGQG